MLGEIFIQVITLNNEKSSCIIKENISKGVHHERNEK